MNSLYCNKYNFNQYYYILIFTNNYCNYKCSYCYNRKNNNNHNIDFNALDKYIEIIKLYINRKIILTFIGGEPTLHPNFIDYCNKKVKDKIKVEILTNLSQPLFFFNQLNTDVHITATYHAQYANMELFIEKCIKLNNVKDIIIMYDPFNIKKSIECFDRITKIISYGRNIELNYIDGYLYSDQQINLFNHYKSHTITYNIDGEYKQFNEIAKYNRQSFKGWLCNAGKDTQYIHCDGKIYFCESYYSENMLPYTSIYAKKINFINHPIICKCNNCAGNYFINKIKHFKINDLYKNNLKYNG